MQVCTIYRGRGQHAPACDGTLAQNCTVRNVKHLPTTTKDPWLHSLNRAQHTPARLRLNMHSNLTMPALPL